MTVVGMASSIAEALRQARALQPDVILVDIGLGAPPAVAAWKTLRARVRAARSR